MLRSKAYLKAVRAILRRSGINLQRVIKKACVSGWHYLQTFCFLKDFILLSISALGTAISSCILPLPIGLTSWVALVRYSSVSCHQSSIRFFDITAAHREVYLAVTSLTSTSGIFNNQPSKKNDVLPSKETTYDMVFQEHFSASISPVLPTQQRAMSTVNHELVEGFSISDHCRGGNFLSNMIVGAASTGGLNLNDTGWKE